jgi:GGDEF domain-containing protein
VKAATKVQNGRAVALYGMKEDITLERQRWEQLRHSIDYDWLTGLGNRAQFNARFLDHAPGSEALNPLGALALINLDNLGEINRRWGLAAGDACLTAFARRLLAASPDGAFAARLGSHEFAMLLKSEVPVGAPGTGNLFSSLAEPVLWHGSLIPFRFPWELSISDSLANFGPKRCTGRQQRHSRWPGGEKSNHCALLP